MTQTTLHDDGERITADTADPCAECGNPIGTHSEAHAYLVLGRHLVGNAKCAQALHEALTDGQRVRLATARIGYEASIAPSVTIVSSR